MTLRGDFGARFRQLIAGRPQKEVAEVLGISQPYISRLARGSRPSRELVQRLASVFGLDEDEWLRLAGYATQETEEERLTAIATRAAEEALRRAGILPESGAQRLVRGLQELNREHGRPIPVDLSRGLDVNGSLTIGEAEAILLDLRRQLQDGLI